MRPDFGARNQERPDNESTEDIKLGGSKKRNESTTLNLIEELGIRPP